VPRNTLREILDVDGPSGGPVSAGWSPDPPAEAGLLTSAEVAVQFGVKVKEVSRWARQDVLPSVRTPGGQHRYRQADVDALLKASREKYEG
jgi:excisionase family DNA binding protein